MKQQEGVIQFELKYTRAPPLPHDRLLEINAWRKILHLLGLTGQDPGRYGGLAYGNISQRVAPFDAPAPQRRFVISGTQTGGLADLDESHYALVLECRPESNRVVAEGPVRPSSEALTHGALYGADPGLRFVMHVHSPKIWRNACALGIPCTDSAAGYGTPAMAAEVARLLKTESVSDGKVLAMGGHEDGIVAFGHTADEAGTALVKLLASAFQLASK